MSNQPNQGPNSPNNVNGASQGTKPYAQTPSQVGGAVNGQINQPTDAQALGLDSVLPPPLPGMQQQYSQGQQSLGQQRQQPMQPQQPAQPVYEQPMQGQQMPRQMPRPQPAYYQPLMHGQRPVQSMPVQPIQQANQQTQYGGAPLPPQPPQTAQPNNTGGNNGRRGGRGLRALAYAGMIGMGLVVGALGLSQYQSCEAQRNCEERSSRLEHMVVNCCEKTSNHSVMRPRPGMTPGMVPGMKPEGMGIAKPKPMRKRRKPVMHVRRPKPMNPCKSSAYVAGSKDRDSVDPKPCSSCAEDMMRDARTEPETKKDFGGIKPGYNPVRVSPVNPEDDGSNPIY